MIPANPAPKSGDISTAAEMTTAKIPTPIRKARDNPECLPEKPSTILAIPFIRNAIPMNMIMVIAAATGNDIAMAAKIRTSMPRPIFDLRAEKIPIMICSIPTKKKISRFYYR